MPLVYGNIPKISTSNTGYIYFFWLLYGCIFVLRLYETESDIRECSVSLIILYSLLY